MKKGTVAVGYLDDGHNWSACFGLSLRNMFMYDMVIEKRFRGGELRLTAGTATIPQARNNMVRTFLAGEAEWLFMVDTDMGFTDDTVERLLKSAHAIERPIVGALCFALRGSPQAHTVLHAARYDIVPTVYEWVELEDEVGFAPMHNYPRNAMVQTAATGAACMIMHRTAAEKIRDKYGEEWFSQTTHPTGDRGKPRTFSEDLSFCVRVAGVDLPLYVNTRVKTTHDKGGLFLDEDTYDQWRATVDLAPLETKESA